MSFWEFAHNNPGTATLMVLIGAALVDAWIDTWRK